MNFQAMHKQRKFVLIAALAGVISIFLPWISTSGLFAGFNVNGFSGGGVIVFITFIVAGAVAFMGDQTKPMEKNMWLIALVAAGVGFLFCVIRFSQISGNALGIVSPGYGLFIAAAASLAALVSAWLFRTPGDTLQSGFDSLKKNISNATSNTGAAPTNTTPTNTRTSGIAELERLIQLKNDGKITEEEYQAMKAKIM
jgi:hypothetical protein